MRHLANVLGMSLDQRCKLNKTILISNSRLKQVFLSNRVFTTKHFNLERHRKHAYRFKNVYLMIWCPLSLMCAAALFSKYIQEKHK